MAVPPVRFRERRIFSDAKRARPSDPAGAASPEFAPLVKRLEQTADPDVYKLEKSLCTESSRTSAKSEEASAGVRGYRGRRFIHCAHWRERVDGVNTAKV